MLADSNETFEQDGAGKLEDGEHFVFEDGQWTQGGDNCFGFLPDDPAPLSSIDVILDDEDDYASLEFCSQLQRVGNYDAIIQNFCGAHRQVFIDHAGSSVHRRAYRLKRSSKRKIRVFGTGAEIVDETEWDMNYGQDVRKKLGYAWHQNEGFTSLILQNNTGRWVCFDMLWKTTLGGGKIVNARSTDMLRPQFHGGVATWPPGFKPIFLIKTARTDPWL